VPFIILLQLPINLLHGESYNGVFGEGLGLVLKLGVVGRQLRLLTDLTILCVILLIVFGLGRVSILLPLPVWTGFELVWGVELQLAGAVGVGL